MTKAELIEILEAYPDDMKVVIFNEHLGKYLYVSTRKCTILHDLNEPEFYEKERCIILGGKVE